MKYAQQGDKALFIFSSGKQVFGVIEFLPPNAGGTWILTEIHEGKEGATVYIQQFEMMYLK